MDRIVLEVDSRLARAWREASSELRENLEKDIEALLAKKIKEAEKEDFEKALNNMRANAARNGMTQEILERLLNED